MQALFLVSLLISATATYVNVCSTCTLSEGNAWQDCLYQGNQVIGVYGLHVYPASAITVNLCLCSNATFANAPGSPSANSFLPSGCQSFNIGSQSCYTLTPSDPNVPFQYYLQFPNPNTNTLASKGEGSLGLTQVNTSTWTSTPINAYTPSSNSFNASLPTAQGTQVLIVDFCPSSSPSPSSSSSSSSTTNYPSSSATSTGTSSTSSTGTSSTSSTGTSSTSSTGNTWSSSTGSNPDTPCVATEGHWRDCNFVLPNTPTPYELTVNPDDNITVTLTPCSNATFPSPPSPPTTGEGSGNTGEGSLSGWTAPTSVDAFTQTYDAAGYQALPIGGVSCYVLTPSNLNTPYEGYIQFPAVTPPTSEGSITSSVGLLQINTTTWDSVVLPESYNSVTHQINATLPLGQGKRILYVTSIQNDNQVGQTVGEGGSTQVAAGANQTYSWSLVNGADLKIQFNSSDSTTITVTPKTTSDYKTTGLISLKVFFQVTLSDPTAQHTSKIQYTYTDDQLKAAAAAFGASIADATKLYLAKYDTTQNKWVSPPTGLQIDTKNKVVSQVTNSFSQWGVFYGTETSGSSRSEPFTLIGLLLIAIGAFITL